MIEAERLEAHWLACMASLGGGARVTRAPLVTVVANPVVAGSMANFMVLRDAQPEALPETLALGGAVLAGYGRPPALFVAPHSGNVARLAASLRDLGWRQAVRQEVLVCALDDLPGSGGGDVTVEQAPPARLSAWGDLLVSAYEVEPNQGAQIRAGWLGLDGEVRYYLALVGGRPVGTGLTWRQADLGGLYCGAVLPGYRRQGIAKALLTQRMRDLAAAGARWAFLQTEADSPMAALAREHLRFDVAYERALWIPV